MDLDDLARAVSASGSARTIVGIAGPPGGGKTTLARALCEATGFAHSPGDGFIIDASFADADGTFRDRGTVSGFDTAGYATLLRDVRRSYGTADVTVPNYRHTQDGAGADAWVVPREARGVVTECNFLGSGSHGWPEVRGHLDVLIYVDQTWEVCRPRLMERQLAKGRTPAEAATRVDSHDRENFLEATRAAALADFVVPGANTLR
ncbi:MAG: nucleoside/nucleotide kinase family protein [Actinobacteria bacterium HGW-Actinobacteria-4]|nr:MAG: nucleoside/nucleotide kinase family protein [Actinobacteria bacterium HGW-Actinobacteria-4]